MCSAVCDFNPPNVHAHLSKLFFFSDLQMWNSLLISLSPPEYQITADYHPFKNGWIIFDAQYTSDLFQLFQNWEEISSQREFPLILFGIMTEN